MRRERDGGEGMEEGREGGEMKVGEKEWEREGGRWRERGREREGEGGREGGREREGGMGGSEGGRGRENEGREGWRYRIRTGYTNSMSRLLISY